MALPLKTREQCGFDAVSLGEVMLRLDPGKVVSELPRQFHAWEGGGEYNVTRGLRKCFGLRTAVVSAFVDNEVGHLIEDCIMQGGVCTDFLVWHDDDGMDEPFAMVSISRNVVMAFGVLSVAQIEGIRPQVK